MEGKHPVDKHVSILPWRPKGKQHQNCERKIKDTAGFHNVSHCDRKDGYADCNVSKRTKLDEQYSAAQSPVNPEDLSDNFGIENQVIDFENVQILYTSDGSAANTESQDNQYHTSRISQHAESKHDNLPCSENFSEGVNSVTMPPTASYMPCLLSPSNIITSTSQSNDGALSASVTASKYPEMMYQQSDTTGNDQGYISQSTCSYPSPQDAPEIECSAMDQGSQIDNAQANEGCYVANNFINWDYLGDQNQCEDLPNQFLNFFKNRLETEMHRFWGSMCELLYEQQCHVQLIVDAAVRDSNTQPCADGLAPCDAANNDSEDQTNGAYTVDCTAAVATAPTGTALSATAPSATAPSATAPLDTAQISTAQIGVPDHCLAAVLSSTNTSPNEGKQSEHENKMKQLLDIMTLSCSVSSLLSKPQFKS